MNSDATVRKRFVPCIVWDGGNRDPILKIEHILEVWAHYEVCSEQLDQNVKKKKFERDDFFGDISELTNALDIHRHTLILELEKLPAKDLQYLSRDQRTMMNRIRAQVLRKTGQERAKTPSEAFYDHER